MVAALEIEMVGFYSSQSCHWCSSWHPLIRYLCLFGTIHFSLLSHRPITGQFFDRLRGAVYPVIASDSGRSHSTSVTCPATSPCPFTFGSACCCGPILFLTFLRDSVICSNSRPWFGWPWSHPLSASSWFAVGARSYFCALPGTTNSSCPWGSRGAWRSGGWYLSVWIYGSHTYWVAAGTS